MQQPLIFVCRERIYASVKSVGDDAYIVPRADVGIRPYRP